MAKNQMFLKPTDHYDGQTVEDIRRWATTKDDMAPVYKRKKKEVSLWNKLAKVLHKSNPEITSDWKNISYDHGRYNHIFTFIINIKQGLESKDFELEDINKITIEDNGSRGLATTMDMLLHNHNGHIILLKTIHCNAFYYM